MFPSDPTGSLDDFILNSLNYLNPRNILGYMEETLVFIDEGFLDKLTKLFGEGKRIKFDKFDFANRITKKQNLICKHLFYYTCPPFQSEVPSEVERNMKEGYDKFILTISKNKSITIRQGRCQRIINPTGKKFLMN